MPIQDLAQKATDTIHEKADPKTLRILGDLSFAAGFASIAASIAIWAVKRADNEVPHAERFGIFVGLWAPTFFILSNRLERYAERVEEGKVP
jgi:hypothetical protein